MSELASALSDRLNPVLVKELRQALRGRQFLVGFWTTLCAVTVIGVWVLLSMVRDGELAELGGRFSSTIYGFMAVALLVIVPVMSFFSMAAEWDEDTHDLLTLSGLGPRRIVAGKLSSALVQALLFLCAFGPFLAFSFLLRGVDLVALALSVALALCASLALASLGIALASLARGRFVRVVMLVVLLGAAGYMAFMLIVFTHFAQRESFVDLSQPEQQAAFGLGLLALAVLGGLGFTVACSRLSHAEENRSSGLRAFATGAILAGCGWALWMTRLSRDGEVLVAMTAALCFLAAFTAVFTTTEPEPLGRRSALRMPRSRLVALLLTPFLPGGGRGVLLFWLHLALSGAVLAAGPLLVPSMRHWRDTSWLTFAVLCAYLLGLVLLPAGLAARASRRPRVRVLARVSMALLFLGSTFVPTLIGFFVGSRPLMEMEHGGNLFWVLIEVADGSVGTGAGLGIGIAFVIALLALGINAPRVVRGLGEVLAASRARAELRRRARADEEAHAGAGS